MAATDEHLLVELWESNNKGWERLPKQQRKNILDQIGTGVGKLVEQGVQLVGFFVNDPKEGKYREHWQFVAVWKLPSKALLDKMLPQVEQLPGWFDVMNEKRVWGKIQDQAAGYSVLLNWGDDNRPHTLMERLRALEKHVAECLEYMKKTQDEPAEAKLIERLQSVETNVREILDKVKTQPRETPIDHPRQPPPRTKQE
jgi:hypothetical protein